MTGATSSTSRTQLIDDDRRQQQSQDAEEVLRSLPQQVTGISRMDSSESINPLPDPATIGTNFQSEENSQENSPSQTKSWRPPMNRAVSRERRRGRKQHRRLVHKGGQYNLSYAQIKERRQRYLADIFTTMLDMKWRWNLLMFVMAFITSWLFFALVWWLISFSHGDLENYGKPNWKPCMDEVYDFNTALLFSIETQHTIGYGGRATTPNCPEAIIVMMVQSCLGVIIQAMMTGVVFAKLSRSKKRAETLMFSKHALISKRDGQLCLLIRLGDMRKSNLIDAHCRGILIKKHVTSEGESLPLYQYDVSFGREDADNKVFLVWPTTLEHTITESSPFWEMSKENFINDNFELLIILEGTVESMGTTAQARTSYLPEEILWGRRFERLVTFQKENGQYRIDYSLFHSSVEMPIPSCSAQKLAEIQQSVRENEEERKYITGSDTMNSSLSGKEEGVNLKLPLIACRSISTQTLDISDNGVSIGDDHNDDVNNNDIEYLQNSAASENQEKGEVDGKRTKNSDAEITVC